MPIGRGSFFKSSWIWQKRLSSEITTMLKIEDVQAWKWHHIVVRRLHLLPYMLSMNDGTTHQVSFINTQSNMWWQTRIDTRIMPTKLGINSKHKLLWNMVLLMVWIHSDFMSSSFKQMMPLLQSIHNGYKFFIMNLVINFRKKKLRRTKVERMKMIVFSSYESITLITKLKVFISKTKGLEGFAWIKNGAFVKKTFKD
jgi:hypothetical protein